ncbi:phosphotransferase family enzyme [Haloactinospora alba]|uniref:Phosphotransferase family enzyme n=1 Tax=Haloactinospora alba TaxID=405555 RepID=A0A543NK78_9ACTN|nr:phosphotransferase family enzyme [Haloactinospora alba]
MDGWELVKLRTAADGEVRRSNSGTSFLRLGGPEVETEARTQATLAAHGYPVPDVVEAGKWEGRYFFVEESLGESSLHDSALRDVEETGAVRTGTLNAATEVSTRLLAAQLRTARPGITGSQEWMYRAGFVDNVLTENPDLDHARVHDALATAGERLGELPVSHGHLDYGLPNVFPSGVIDWQHHGTAPVGFDVYPMLDITAFKGGGTGYTFTREQRRSYTAALDAVSVELLGSPLSSFVGDFLLVKCFFFLALMKPKDHGNQRKARKWAYRRALLVQGLESYERHRHIDTGSFPTLDAFSTTPAEQPPREST